MTLALAAPSASVYSETFIHLQLTRLPSSIHIFGGPVASETVPGGPIAPLRCARGLLDLATKVRAKPNRLESLQGYELVRRLKKHHITTIVANYGPMGVQLLPIAKQLGAQLVVHFHGYDAHMKSTVNKYREQYHQLGEDASAIIVVSNSMKRALLDFGIPDHKLHLIRYGVDTARFFEKTTFPDSPIFFSVGRFVDKKAPYLTIHAFAEVYRKYPEARLVMGGDGPLLETCHNLVTLLKLQPAVSFTGVLQPDDVARWMHRATAYVQHSLTVQHGPSAGDSEGTPVAILEAMVTGLPVISTRHAGIADVIEHLQDGLIVAERDVTAMTQMMLAVIEDTPLRSRISVNARQKAIQEFTAEAYMASIMGVINTCT